MNMHSLFKEKKIERNLVERTINDLAGIASGMFIESQIKSSKDLTKFKNPANGLPILIPCIPIIFDYYEKFYIDKSELQKLIFGSVNSSYVGCKLALESNTFAKNFRLKTSFQKKLNAYIEDILLTRQRVQTFVKEYTFVGAFQTRNIPHLGHEKIIDKMLDFCELVVINPMIGPKKNGDIDPAKLGGLYEAVLKPRYKNRIEFLPIRANMFYAGPREAIHHSKIRQWLGFTHFSVGRDHAGAEGVYPQNAAIDMVKKCQGNLSIEIITHGGAFFCSQCGNAVLQDQCNHSKDKLKQISGSNFRHALNLKKTYPFASSDVQKWASKNFDHLLT